MSWKNGLRYRFIKKREKIKHVSASGWSGISLLIIPDDPLASSRQFRINYFVLLFVITSVFLPLLINMFLGLRAVSLPKAKQEKITQTRRLLLETSMSLSKDKKKLFEKIQKQLDEFYNRFPTQKKRQQGVSQFASVRQARDSELENKRAIHRGSYDLDILVPLRRKAQVLVGHWAPFVFQPIWNRMSIHYLMPRGWALLGGVGHVTSTYGLRKNPLEAGTEFHAGVDFAYIAGTPIIATAPGIVLRAVSEPKSGYGKFIQLHHGLGYTSLYAHCQSLAVKEGDMVKRGQVIAYLGRTGRVTGEHLHYEIQLGWARSSNPLPYVKLK